MAYTGSYNSVERIAMAIGAFELVFIFVAWKAHPDVAAMKAGAINIIRQAARFTPTSLWSCRNGGKEPKNTKSHQKTLN